MFSVLIFKFVTLSHAILLISFQNDHMDVVKLLVANGAPDLDLALWYAIEVHFYYFFFWFFFLGFFWEFFFWMFKRRYWIAGSGCRHNIVKLQNFCSCVVRMWILSHAKSPHCSMRFVNEIWNWSNFLSPMELILIKDSHICSEALCCIWFARYAIDVSLLIFRWFDLFLFDLIWFIWIFPLLVILFIEL